MACPKLMRAAQYVRRQCVRRLGASTFVVATFCHQCPTARDMKKSPAPRPRVPCGSQVCFDRHGCAVAAAAAAAILAAAPRPGPHLRRTVQAMRLWHAACTQRKPDPPRPSLSGERTGGPQNGTTARDASRVGVLDRRSWLPRCSPRSKAERSAGTLGIGDLRAQAPAPTKFFSQKKATITSATPAASIPMKSFCWAPWERPSGRGHTACSLYHARSLISGQSSKASVSLPTNILF